MPLLWPLPLPLPRSPQSILQPLCPNWGYRDSRPVVASTAINWATWMTWMTMCHKESWRDERFSFTSRLERVPKIGCKKIHQEQTIGQGKAWTIMNEKNPPTPKCSRRDPDSRSSSATLAEPRWIIGQTCVTPAGGSTFAIFKSNPRKYLQIDAVGTGCLVSSATFPVVFPTFKNAGMVLEPISPKLFMFVANSACPGCVSYGQSSGDCPIFGRRQEPMWLVRLQGRWHDQQQDVFWPRWCLGTAAAPCNILKPRIYLPVFKEV